MISQAISYTLQTLRSLWSMSAGNLLLSLPIGLLVIYWVRYLFRKVRKLLF